MPSNDLTRELPQASPDELHTSYSPRRRRRTFILLSAVSALFAVTGAFAWTALPPLERAEDTPPRSTPRDLVTDGLGGSIAIETQAPTMPSGRSSALVSGPVDERTEASSSPVRTAPAIPSVACDAGTSTVLAGATKTIGCSVRPNGYRGDLTPRCPTPLTVYTCDVSPAHVRVASDDAISVVAWWTFDVLTPPKSYRLQLELGRAIGTRAFDVSVPSRLGTYDIACSPDKLELPSTGAGQVECVVSSVDGFDGYVRLFGGASTALWTVEMEPVVVRVSPTAPATAPIDVRTEGLLPGSYPQIFAVHGEVFEHVERSAFIWIEVLEVL